MIVNLHFNCLPESALNRYIVSGRQKFAMKDEGFLPRTFWSQARQHRHNFLQGKGLQSARTQGSRFWEQDVRATLTYSEGLGQLLN